MIIDKPNNANVDMKPVYSLPYDIGGLMVIPRSKTASAYLRNCYGSYQFKLTFDLLASPTPLPKDRPVVCELPIAKHKTKNLSLISSTTGKKSSTTFNFTEKLGRYERWQASCTYLREDQIPLHAHESGIEILGDEKYARLPIPAFRELKRGFKANRKDNNEFPYHGQAIYLSTLELPDGRIVQTKLPNKMSVFMRLLSLS